MLDKKQKKILKAETSPNRASKKSKKQHTATPLTDNFTPSKTSHTPQTHATTLGDNSIPVVQRQQMASQLGLLGGNNYLQNVVLQMKQDKQASSPIIQRDINGEGEVPYGTFKIDMVENRDNRGKLGEDGTITFIPNETGPDTEKISLIQAINISHLDNGQPQDRWGDLSNLNNMRTTGEDVAYTTQAGDTLTSIAATQDHVTSDDLQAMNETVLEQVNIFDVNTQIPPGMLISLPKVKDGYVIDHNPSSKKNVEDRVDNNQEVKPYYRDYAPYDITQDGYKRGDDIAEASLYDFPGTAGYSVSFDFETVARAEDIGLDYGTIHWGFKRVLNEGIQDETCHVEEGTSETFDATLTEFNKFYKNPHTVIEGETLQEISERYYGTSDHYYEILVTNWTEIYEANKEAGEPVYTTIQPGLKLRIPNITELEPDRGQDAESDRP